MRKCTVLLAVCALIGTLGAAAPPTRAGGFERCPAARLCLFANADGTGTMAYFASGSPDLAQQAIDNDTSAYWNRTGANWDVFDLPNYQERIYTLWGDETAPIQLSHMTWEDSYSSLRRQ
ncbi:peptidase inhibitor family I36 protein [Streptomyces sp. NPDC002559]